MEENMFRRTTMFAAAAFLALGAAGCAENTTAPAEEPLNVDLVAVDDYGFTREFGPRQGCAAGPGTCFGSGPAGGENRSYLGTLVQEAYQKLAAQDQAAAEAAFAELWGLHQEAFALRSTDRAAFSAAMQAAHAKSAELVIEVLGAETAGTVIDRAVARLDTLKAVIVTSAAAGKDVSRLQYVADRAGSFLAEAQAALAAHDAVKALDLGSRALQAATAGGGQNARGPGAGLGMGGGRQHRGGR
jgi:hypothetical protein